MANGVRDLFDLTTPVSSSSYVERLQAFCLRWRLSSLAAPNLPVPLQPQMPAPSLLSVTGQMNAVGATYYLPDTFPLPSREELRSMMEESLRGADTPDHLASWMSLVRGENRAKNQIVRFGRLFEIQHYARILQERQPAIMHRRLGALERAFATFFDVSIDAIHLDLQVVRQRLGDQWILRGNNVETA